MAEGDAADSVYVLIAGMLTVSKTLDGQRAVLAQVTRPGTVVGEMVSLGGGSRTATVSAERESELYRLSAAHFRRLLAEYPILATELAATAVRRAEEGELAEILIARIGIVDQETVTSACAKVEWVTLDPHQVLHGQGDPSHAVYFVVRGRLVATTADPGTEELRATEEFAKGDVIGELGVLGNTPRVATVTAVRHSVVARMAADHFLGLVEKVPRLMVDLALEAVSRATSAVQRASPTTIIAVAAPGLDRETRLAALTAELSRFGRVQLLTSQRVDALLETPGVSNTEIGDLGDVRVSRLVHEFELDSDHLLIDLGDEDSPWARRALALADRILVFTPARPNPGQVGRTSSLLAGCPIGIARTLVVEHSDGAAPANSTDLLELLACGEVLNVLSGSLNHLGRVARVAAGRGNALVIGGGGARGFAHIGAYRALYELGIPIDIVGGTSIGGVLGAFIADGQTPEDLIETASRRFMDVLDYTLPIVSLIKGEKITRSATDAFGDRTIEDLRMTYFCVSADLTSSRIHLHTSGPIVLAIRATSAIPGVMPPVPSGDALLVDGGVLNNLPLDVARSFTPAGRVIAFDVAPPQGPGAHGDYGLSVSGWSAFRARRSSSRTRYPRISAILLRSMITASMRERDRQIHSGLGDFYINLDIRGTSMLDFSDPAGVANKGYDAAMPALEAWLASQA